LLAHVLFDNKIVEDIFLDLSNDQKQKLLRFTTDHHMTFNSLFWVRDIRIKHISMIFIDYSLIFIILKKIETALSRGITHEMIFFVWNFKNCIKIFVFREGFFIFDFEFIERIEVFIGKGKHFLLKILKFFRYSFKLWFLKEFTLVPTVAKNVKQDRLGLNKGCWRHNNCFFWLKFNYFFVFYYKFNF
jgi:hypothetical protein